MMKFTEAELKHVSTCLHGLGDCQLRDYVVVVVTGALEEVDGLYLVRARDFTVRHANLLQRFDWVGKVSHALVWKILECFTQLDHEGKNRWIVPTDVDKAHFDELRQQFKGDPFIYADRLNTYKLSFNQAALAKQPSAVAIVHLHGKSTLKAEHFPVFQRTGSQSRPVGGYVAL